MRHKLIHPLWVHSEQPIIPEDTSKLEWEIGSMTEQGKSWIYWDVQNPRWMNWVVVITALDLTVAAILVFAHVPWLSVLLVSISLGLITLYGGLHTSVMPDKVEVRIGLLGFRLLRIRLADIENVEVQTFSPLSEYGGYGVRYNPRLRTRAYYFRGNQGVLVTLRNGKKYLIGSDHSENLASVMRVAIRYAG